MPTRRQPNPSEQRAARSARQRFRRAHRTSRAQGSTSAQQRPPSPQSDELDNSDSERQDQASEDSDDDNEAQTSEKWYDKFPHLHITPYTASFSNQCPHCGCRLLKSNYPASSEDKKWCCNNGTGTAFRHIPKLRPYPESMRPLIYEDAEFKKMIRWVNNTFSFSRLVVTGSEIHFDGPSNVVMCGRSYHIMKHLDGEYEGALKWFLFDPQGFERHADRFQIPQHFITPWKQFLGAKNPYVNTIKQQLEFSDPQNFEIHVRQSVASGEIAAISNPFNLNRVRGRKVVIMRNLSIDKNLIKNTKVIVRQIYRYSIKVEVLYDDNRPAQRDNQHAISRINFSFNPQGANWTIVRMQFPLRLAYASTFNSCQGLTLDRIWVDFEVQVFAHGQLYTALSRVRRGEHIKGLIPEGNQKIVRNVVIKDLITL